MLHQRDFSICRLVASVWKWSHHSGQCRQPVSLQQTCWLRNSSCGRLHTAHNVVTMPCCRLVISRYTQWMVTTPTLIYVVSKISDFSRAQVATVVLSQFSVILTGLISSVSPAPWKCKASLQDFGCLSMPSLPMLS